MPGDRAVTHIGVSGNNTTDTNYAPNLTGNAVTIESIYIIPKVAVATNGTNYITATISAGGTTLATFTTNSSGGAAMVAGTPINLTLASTGVGAAMELADGAVATVSVANGGTGPAYNFTTYFKLRFNRV